MLSVLIVIPGNNHLLLIPKCDQPLSDTSTLSFVWRFKMYPRKLVNSVWIFFPVTLYIASMVFFGYFFLFAEELHIKEDAVGEKIDSIDLWVEKLLSKSEYERYRFLNQHCNQTLTKSVPKFTKLVLFIIDAFRSDFVSSISNNDRFVDSLPYMKQLMHSHGKLVDLLSIH